MTGDSEKRPIDQGRLILGATLIVLGILLLGPLFGIHWGRYLWPFFIIVPGLVLFFLALAARGGAGEALAVPASIVTMMGGILLYQSITGHWTSWAYAWALVAPTSIGLGQAVYGSLKGRPKLVRSGIRVATIGVVIFLAGAIFFELIINVSGLGRNPLIWAVGLIGLGALLLLRTLLPSRLS